MKNIITNNLKYAGIVTLSQRIGNKKIPISQIHNNGNLPLFNFLTECLAGNFETAKTIRPTKIMVLKRIKDTDVRTGEEKVVFESMSSFIYLLATPEKRYSSETAAISKVCFSFILTRDLLETIDFEDNDSNTTYMLGLYPANATRNDLSDYSAICELNPSNINSSNIGASSVLVVDWELAISDGAI
jgi:hypothetical protein